MEEIVEKLIDKAGRALNEKVLTVSPAGKITNNKVFIIETQSGRYIFKIYKSGWPEEGKLLFVNRAIKQASIARAEILHYTRSDEDFPHGYLIEECLPGATADKLEFTVHEEAEIYKKLAGYIGRVHRIKLDGCGYIGSGKPCCASYTDFIDYSFGDNTDKLVGIGVIGQDELDLILGKLMKELAVLDRITPSLCHGDLSDKNILVGSDSEITLIDWDDALSLPWTADISRFTLWLKLDKSPEEAECFRGAFLDSYVSGGDKRVFYETEKSLHVLYALEYMNFFLSGEAYDKANALFREALCAL